MEILNLQKIPQQWNIIIYKYFHYKTRTKSNRQINQRTNSLEPTTTLLTKIKKIYKWPLHERAIQKAHRTNKCICLCPTKEVHCGSTIRLQQTVEINLRYNSDPSKNISNFLKGAFSLDTLKPL